MAEAPTFGRRQVSGHGPRLGAALQRPLPRPAPEPSSSAEVEAFAASLRREQGGRGEDAAFDDWLKSQKARRLRFYVIRFLFMAPGILCFVIQAPDWVSIGLEIAGGAANVWVRGERKRQTKDIVTWTAEQP